MARTATGFGGAITTTGRSGALRLEKSFFQAHPEFRLKAKLRVHHIGPGQLLVSVEDGPNAAAAEEAHDPIVSAYLAFLEKDMAANPGSLSPFTGAELDKLADLMSGVSVPDLWRPSAPEEATGGRLSVRRDANRAPRTGAAYAQDAAKAADPDQHQ